MVAVAPDGLAVIEPDMTVIGPNPLKPWTPELPDGVKVKGIGGVGVPPLKANDMVAVVVPGGKPE